MSKRGITVSELAQALAIFQRKTPEQKEEILRQIRELVAKKDD